MTKILIKRQLAEVFRQGPNFLKLCVLRVFEGSQRHLDKVYFNVLLCTLVALPLQNCSVNCKNCNITSRDSNHHPYDLQCDVLLTQLRMAYSN